jgi:hypothetical protein
MTEVTEKMMRHILKKVNTPAGIADKIREYGQIDTVVNSFVKERKHAKDHYEKTLEEIKVREQKIQEKCDHPDITKYGDPSGGNDSSYQCNVCCKWFDYSTEWTKE